MGLLTQIKAGLTAFRNPKLLPALSNTNLLQAQISTLRLYPNYQSYDNAERYCTSDDVYAVISLIAQTCALIPMYAYEVKDDRQAKKLMSLKANAAERIKKFYEIKALEDLPENDPLVQLMDSPNDYQSSYEFGLWAYSWFFVKGECIIHKERPELGVNAGKVTALNIWEPDNVSLIVTTTFPFRIVNYVYTLNGQDIMIAPPEDIIHIKNPNLTQWSYTGDNLRGFSALEAFRKRFNRMDANLDVSIAQMQNGGLPGVLFDKNTEDAVEIIGRRKQDYSDFIRNRGNVGNVYMASGELGYLPIGSELVDMMLAELGQIDFKKLCNLFHISARLFNEDGTGSEVSDGNARKGLYLQACLPATYLFRDCYNRQLAPEFTDKKRRIQSDSSEIPELQENMKDLATWVKDFPYITPNEKREMIKFDRDDSDPIMDKIIIPSGMMLLSDLSLEDVQPIGDE